MKARHFAFAAGGLVALAAASTNALALTREEVLVRARAYTVHRWSSTSANQTASCSAAYKSLFPPGDYVGLPYDWGGYMSLFTFDQQIAQGFGAGSQETDDVLACTAGVDCSGFVSMAWGTGHFTTSTIPASTTTIAMADLLPGDVFNKAGYHVAMFTHALASGEPALVEAAGYNVHVNGFGGLSYVSGYTPRRHASVTGTTAGNPVGTTSNPIVIGALPYVDSRNTALSPSSVLDGCAATPGTAEKGPEIVYQIDVKQPGTLNVSVQDDAATDVDVELLSNLSTKGCVARNDGAITAEVGCGTYWIVVDSFGANASKAGPYTLNVNVTASGAACGAVPGPPTFAPKGKLGDACAYPGHESLPFCNPNLGSDTCIYGTNASFCSTACAKDADCTGMPGGGCCQDLGKGELYCMTQSYCKGGSSGLTPGGASSNGGSGASGSSGGGPDGSSGQPDGEPAGSASASSSSASSGASGAAPAEQTTTTTGGCSTSSGARKNASWMLPLLLAGLLLARGRRR